MEFVLRVYIFFGNLLLKQKCIMRYATMMCLLPCLPTLMNFISLALPFLCIYLQQINLLLSTDQTRKRKLICEMNTNIVSSYDPELSFVLTYIHNLYARAYYMFEVYLDFAHIYAH